jgi:hypothetical protein
MNRRDSMDMWWANLQRERDRRPESPSALVAEVIGKCLTSRFHVVGVEYGA